MYRLSIATLVGLFFTIPAPTVLAQTVTSTVEGDNGGVFTSDPRGPSSSPVSSGLSFFQTFDQDFSGEGFGRATQRPDGIGAVAVNVLFANGLTGNYVEARTTWTDSATNNGGAPADYDFQFFITPAVLRISDFAGLSNTDPQRPDVSFDVIIRANGAVVFQTSANLIGGNQGHVLIESGTSLSPVFTNAGPGFGYDFQSYVDTVNLGTVAPGGTMTVEYEMVARVDTPGFEAGGRSQIGDPFDLTSSPGVLGTFLENGTVATESRSWGKLKSLYR